MFGINLTTSLVRSDLDYDENIRLSTYVWIQQVYWSIVSSADKVSNFLGDRKEEVVTAPLSEKKLSTKDVDNGGRTDKKLTSTLVIQTF